MRSPSRGRDAEVREESGRQAAVAAAAPHVTHAGRGGAGNVRSPSRDPAERKKIELAQREEALLQQKAQASEASHPHTTGRGGAGNIKSSSTTNSSNSRDHSEDRGRGRNGENGAPRGGPVGNVSLSKEREEGRMDLYLLSLSNPFCIYFFTDSLLWSFNTFLSFNRSFVPYLVLVLVTQEVQTILLLVVLQEEPPYLK